MPMLSRRERLRPIAFDRSTNASLWFDKFIESQDARGDGEARSAEKPKQTLIDEMTQILVSDIYCSFYKRWEANLCALGAETRVLCIDGRMIVGLGGESVLETSITLHRIYGVPFIPGSALKGLAAKYAVKLEDARWRKDAAPIIEISEGKKINPHQFIFGSQDSAGFIVFHDALLIPQPNSSLPLHAEIMTVHHAGYYGEKGEKPPADWDAPNPVPFLSASGKYLLALSAPTGAKSWLELAFEILRLALQAEGIGAKTSSGYGRATIERSAAETLAAQEAHAVEEFINRVSALSNANVANQINQHYQTWKGSQLSAASRQRMAQAIIDKVRAAKREKVSKDKAWYQELLEFTGGGQ